MIAPCGIDCEKCDIRLLPSDPSAAKRVIEWYRSMEWIGPEEGVKEALEKKMYCRGCPGDREIHWSPDCHILKCCVDQHGLRHCSECDDFVCDHLTSWSQKSEKYAKAVQSLREMRDAD
jgi:hypothetical protein